MADDGPLMSVWCAGVRRHASLRRSALATGLAVIGSLPWGFSTLAHAPGDLRIGAVAPPIATAIVAQDIPSDGSYRVVLAAHASGSVACDVEDPGGIAACPDFPVGALGGIQHFSGSFNVQVAASIPLTAAANPIFQTGVGGAAEAVEQDADFTGTGSYEDSMTISLCGRASGTWSQAYAGSSQSGVQTVDSLKAVTDASGDLVDFRLQMLEPRPPIVEHGIYPDTLTASENCQPGSTTFTTTGSSGNLFATRALRLAHTQFFPQQPGAPLNEPEFTGWAIDPTWAPATGGLLATKTFTVSAQFEPPESGQVTLTETLNIVTSACAATATTIGAARALRQSVRVASDACGGPVARIRLMSPVVRAASVALDGYGSTDSTGEIIDYEWTFAPGPDCPSGTKLSNNSGSGRSITIIPLCSIVVTLTVTDDQHLTNRTKGVLLAVAPRTGEFSTTPVTHRDDTAGRDRRSPRGQPTFGATVAENVSGCSQAPAADPAVLCPYVQIRDSYVAKRDTHLHNGYEISVVDDPGGPFDRQWYVRSTSLSIQRLGVYDTHFLPDGPAPSGQRKGKRKGLNFWEANEMRGSDLTGWLQAVLEHEGKGVAGNPAAGHTGAMETAANTDDGNARRRLEPLFAASASELQRTADMTLTEVQLLIWGESRDPRPQVWAGTLYLWDDKQHGWRPFTCAVGGASGCRPNPI